SAVDQGVRSADRRDRYGDERIGVRVGLPRSGSGAQREQPATVLGLLVDDRAEHGLNVSLERLTRRRGILGSLWESCCEALQPIQRCVRLGEASIQRSEARIETLQTRVQGIETARDRANAPLECPPHAPDDHPRYSRAGTP